MPSCLCRSKNMQGTLTGEIGNPQLPELGTYNHQMTTVGPDFAGWDYQNLFLYQSRQVGSKLYREHLCIFILQGEGYSS